VTGKKGPSIANGKAAGGPILISRTQQRGNSKERKRKEATGTDRTQSSLKFGEWGVTGRSFQEFGKGTCAGAECRYGPSRE